MSVQPIYPNGDRIWCCIDEEFGTVKAGTVSHNITTFGFSYQEKDQPGNLNASCVLPLLKRNEEGLQQMGLSIYEVIHRFKVVLGLRIDGRREKSSFCPIRQF